MDSTTQRCLQKPCTLQSKVCLIIKHLYRKEDWIKALEYFKVSLKLDNSTINPDPLGAANTSLTCAVILSKLNKYAESIDYAQSCMSAIEELGNINKNVPLSVYK